MLLTKKFNFSNMQVGHILSYIGQSARQQEDPVPAANQSDDAISAFVQSEVSSQLVNQLLDTGQGNPTGPDEQLWAPLDETLWLAGTNPEPVLECGNSSAGGWAQGPVQELTGGDAFCLDSLVSSQIEDIHLEPLFQDNNKTDTSFGLEFKEPECFDFEPPQLAVNPVISYTTSPQLAVNLVRSSTTSPKLAVNEVRSSSTSPQLAVNLVRSSTTSPQLAANLVRSSTTSTPSNCDILVPDSEAVHAHNLHKAFDASSYAPKACRVDLEKIDLSPMELKDMIDDENSCARFYTNDFNDVCLVKCWPCRQEMDIIKLRKHLDLDHEMSLKIFKQRYHGLTYTKLVYHRCLECGEDMRMEYNELYTHCRSHGLNVAEYRARFNTSSDTSSTPKPRRGRMVFGENASPKSERSTELTRLGERSTEEPGKRRKSFDLDLIKKIAASSILDTDTKDEDYTPDSPGLLNRISSEDDLLETIAPRRKRKYNISERGGSSDKKNKGFTNSNGESCQWSNPSEYQSFSTNRNRESSQASNQWEDEFSSGQIETEMSPSKNVVGRRKKGRPLLSQDTKIDFTTDLDVCESDDDHDENKVFSSDFKEMCKEYCKICCTDVSYMKDHLYRQHELTLPLYCQEYGEIVYTRLTYHRCCLCGKKLVFDFEEMRRHSLKHSFTFKAYKNRYLDPSAPEYIPEEKRTKPHSSTPAYQQEKEKERTDKPSDVCLAEVAAVLPSAEAAATQANAEGVASQANAEAAATPANGRTKKRPQFLRRADLPGLLDKYNHIKEDGRVFSDVLAEQSVFRCEICRKDMTRKSLTKHVIRQHKISFAHYKNRYGDYNPIKTTYYRCKICDAEMIFVYETILDHVRHRHKISLPWYKTNYKAFSDVQGEDRVFSKQLEDMSTYSCPYCGKVILHHLMGRHKKQEHPNRAGGQCKFANKTYYRCVLCGGELLFSRNTIQDHLKSMHNNKSFSSYASIPGAFRGDKSLVLVMDKKDERNREDGEVTDGSLDHDDDDLHSPMRCAKINQRTAISKNKSSYRAHASLQADEGGRESAWMVGNTYTCLICRETTKSESSMASHSLKVHKIHFKDFRSQYTVTDNYYECKICHMEVFHDMAVITAHISEVHQLKVQEYDNIYESSDSSLDTCPDSYLYNTDPDADDTDNDHDMIEDLDMDPCGDQYKEKVKDNECSEGETELSPDIFLGTETESQRENASPSGLQTDSNTLDVDKMECSKEMEEVCKNSNSENNASENSIYSSRLLLFDKNASPDNAPNKVDITDPLNKTSIHCCDKNSCSDIKDVLPEKLTSNREDLICDYNDTNALSSSVTEKSLQVVEIEVSINKTDELVSKSSSKSQEILNYEHKIMKDATNELKINNIFLEKTLRDNSIDGIIMKRKDSLEIYEEKENKNEANIVCNNLEKITVSTVDHHIHSDANFKKALLNDIEYEVITISDDDADNISTLNGPDDVNVKLEKKDNLAAESKEITTSKLCFLGTPEKNIHNQNSPIANIHTPLLDSKESSCVDNIDGLSTEILERSNCTSTVEKSDSIAVTDDTYENTDNVQDIIVNTSQSFKCFTGNGMKSSAKKKKSLEVVDANLDHKNSSEKGTEKNSPNSDQMCLNNTNLNLSEKNSYSNNVKKIIIDHEIKPQTNNKGGQDDIKDSSGITKFTGDDKEINLNENDQFGHNYKEHPLDEITQCLQDDGDLETRLKCMDENSRVYSSNLEDICRVQCRICGKSMRRSLKNRHRLHEEETKYIFLKIVFHRCALCEKSLLFCSSAISRHLKIRHKPFTWSIYRKQYLHGTLDEEGERDEKVKVKAITEQHDEELCKIKDIGHDHKDSKELLINRDKFHQHTMEDSVERVDSMKNQKDKVLKQLDESLRVYSDNLADRLVVKCKLCDEQIRRVQKSQHNLKHNVKAEYTLTKLVFHRCKICGEGIPFCDSSMSNHLLKHPGSKLTWSKYKVQYNLNTKIPMKYSNDLSDVCLVKCNTCNKVMKRSETFHHKIHDKNPQYTTIRRAYHRCKLCNTTVLFCSHNIRTHLIRNHASKGWNLQKYESKYLFQGKINLDKELQEESTLDKEGVEEVEDADSEDDMETNILNCPDNSQWKDIKESSRKYSDNLSDLCRVRCNLCSTELLRGFKIPHSRKHSSKPDYTLSKITFHRCKICQCRVLFCMSNMADHLRKKHTSVSWKTYKTKYLLSGRKEKRLYVTCKNIPESTRVYSDDLAQACLYKCSICGKETEAIYKSKHNKLHWGVKPQYFKSRITFHRCKICGASVPFCPVYIRRHLDMHADLGLTYRSYEVKYLTNFKRSKRKNNSRNIKKDESISNDDMKMEPGDVKLEPEESDINKMQWEGIKKEPTDSNDEEEAFNENKTEFFDVIRPRRDRKQKTYSDMATLDEIEKLDECRKKRRTSDFASRSARKKLHITHHNVSTPAYAESKVKRSKPNITRFSQFILGLKTPGVTQPPGLTTSSMGPDSRQRIDDVSEEIPIILEFTATKQSNSDQRPQNEFLCEETDELDSRSSVSQTEIPNGSVELPTSAEICSTPQLGSSSNEIINPEMEIRRTVSGPSESPTIQDEKVKTEDAAALELREDSVDPVGEATVFLCPFVLDGCRRFCNRRGIEEGEAARHCLGVHRTPPRRLKTLGYSWKEVETNHVDFNIFKPV